MRRLVMPVLVLGVLATASTRAEVDRAGGDDDDGAGARPTSVDAVLAGTNVRITAQFALGVEGPGVAINMHSIGLPTHAVVTSGSVIVAGKRHRMRLEPADAADRAFDALTLKPGLDGERAWALMIAGTGDSVSISVLAPRAASVVVELTLDVPTCFYNDARFIELPRAWWARVRTAQRSAVPVDDEQVAAACQRSAETTTRWLGFASGDLRRQPAGERRIGVIAGRLPLSSKHLARVELDLARELGDIPRDLHTVIVVDHSRSMTNDELEAQRASVAAYLRLAPASRVQVIGYARHARALLPSWMPASHAAPRIDREIRALAQRNGSNVDDALIAAAAWLARVDGTRRVVLFSDERLAERLGAPETLRALLPSSTLLHVVRPETGFGLERDDHGTLAALAAATRGIEVAGGPDDRGHVDALLLLRPTSLDDVQIGAHGWEDLEGFADERACGSSLREGHTCTWWGEGGPAAGPLTISGRLWNTPFQRVVRADPGQARALARLLSATEMIDELRAEIDRLAFAVSSAWSLIAQWGGSGGYEDLGGFGTIGTGRFGTSSRHTSIGMGPGGLRRPPLDLRAQLAPALAGCTAGDAPITVSVETTHEEIVDVAAATPDPVLRDCVVEAVWELTLRIADAPAHATTRVAFGNKR